MKKNQRRKIELLVKVSNEYDVPRNLMKTLLDTAKNFTYENQTATARKKEYHDLVRFYEKMKTR
ncbi:MAG: hypothetical protein GX972_06900 [Amphibacillus sp.]|nr:hypothetical protein [Amphibacillus sp.]